MPWVFDPKVGGVNFEYRLPICWLIFRRWNCMPGPISGRGPVSGTALCSSSNSFSELRLESAGLEAIFDASEAFPPFSNLRTSPSPWWCPLESAGVGVLVPLDTELISCPENHSSLYCWMSNARGHGPNHFLNTMSSSGNISSNLAWFASHSFRALRTFIHRSRVTSLIL